MTFFKSWFFLGALLFASLPGVHALAEDANANRSARHHDSVHYRFGEDYGGQPVIVFADQATVAEGDTANTVLALHGKVNCDGHVLGPVVLVDGTAEINGTLDNGLVLIMTKAKIGPKAVIHGQLAVYGPEPEISPDAVIDEKGPHFIRGSGPVPALLGYLVKGPLWLRPFPPRVGLAWFVVISMFLATFLVTLMFQNRVVNCANVLRERPIACFFSGVGFRILTPLGLVLMVCTVILILVVPFVLFLLLAAVLLGKAAMCVAIGRRCLSAEGDPSPGKVLLSFVVGSVLIYALYMVPFLGMLVFLVVSPMILGAAILSRFGSPRLKLSPPASPVSPPPRAPAGFPAAGPTEFPGPIGAAAHSATPARPEDAATSAIPATSLAVLQVSVPETGESVSAPPTTTPAPPPAPAPGPIPTPVFTPNPNPNPDPTMENSTSRPTSAGAPPPFAPIPPARATSERPPFTTSEILAAPRASFWMRIAAIILDLIVVNAMVAYVFRDRFFVRGFFDGEEGFLLLWLAYNVGMWVWKGTTLGGSVLGLKCVRTSGEPLDWRVAVIRALGSCLSFLALGIGFFWIAWDPGRQSWHDHIADTMIVKMPRAIPLV